MTGSEEMEAAPTWQITHLHFAADTSMREVNERLADLSGWEPFAAIPRAVGWGLLLRRVRDAD